MPTMDLSPVLDRLNVGPVTLHRYSPPVQNEYGGFTADLTPTEVSLDPVIVHTVSGRDLDQVPEADRTKETIQVYSTVPLIEGTDRIAYQGRTFRIAKAFDESLNGGYFLAYATLEEPGGGA